MGVPQLREVLVNLCTGRFAFWLLEQRFSWLPHLPQHSSAFCM